MRFAGTRLAIAGMFVLSALDQAAAADAPGGFKAETIKAIFVELGAKDMQVEVAQGDPRLVFKIYETIFVIDFFQCEVAGCNAMQYIASYEPDASDTVEAVNRYNTEYVFGKAALDPKEGLLSTRGVLWSPGSSKAQVVNEFEMFVTSTINLINFLKKSVTASAPSVGDSAPLAGVSGTPEPTGIATARLKGLPKNRR